jgi:glycosyltransferase involved in cell wall biosynthesis
MESLVFSVIIPHKNIPDLLQRCLNSIPKRDDIQIIVVDDNSDASQVDFDNFPGLNDNHVEVYLTKEGKGAGYARNVGLIHAKGKWLLFADADDFFTEDAFEHFFAQQNSSHEIIYFKVTSCYSDTYEPADRGDYWNEYVEDYFHRKKDSENRLRYRHCVPWGKMIKIELIRRKNIRFEEVVTSNDMMFSIIVATAALSIGVINNTVYKVTMRRGSLCNTYTYEMLLSRYLTVIRVNRFLKDNEKYKYQYSVGQYIYLVVKYGIIPFFYFIRLSIWYKNNIFIGVFNVKHYVNYLRFRKRIKEREVTILKTRT